MKNRKRGFSLVELLIVLAVIAALIATITPVALNAIKKSKATQVAQNIKTLASAFENALYVDPESVPTFDNLGRDIDSLSYGIYYTETNGNYTVAVITSEEADGTILESLVQTVEEGPYAGVADEHLGGYTDVDNAEYYYEFSFTVY